jgi:alpha-L-rhamnosidase
MNTPLPSSLKCEHLENPLGLDETAPRLSWQIRDSRQGAKQSAYRIAAASTQELLESRPDLWDSGKVRGDGCLDVTYAGKKLGSRQRVFWRVMTWDHKGKGSAWSEAAFFETGLLKPGGWTARWIGGAAGPSETGGPCPRFRREFRLEGKIRSARLYITARGVFEARINGQRVGRDHFAPGWTEYAKRIQVLVYDVTGLLTGGDNAIGLNLGEGWYKGRLGWEKARQFYGNQPSILAQLEVEGEDGRQVIASGPDWKTAEGPLLSSSIYDGETHDAQRETPGWDLARFNDSGWQAARVEEAPVAALVAQRNEPVRQQEELPTRALTEPAYGIHVFDLGQNMVGWARVKIRAQPGDTVTLRYAEMLSPDGTLYTANLRSAKCIDRYICRGNGEEVYEPTFTFHGFRYVELTGLREKPGLGDVTGVALYSAMAQTGRFECSEPLVNQLQSNIEWGLKGNFLDIPTDCPQRDERLGWTGDAQVFIRTACFNRDVAAFFTKWCQSIADSQHDDGSIPFVVPDIFRNGSSCAAWADAGVICPWTLYLCYGDTGILRRQYRSMERWIEWQREHSRDLILDNACFGDWLAIDIAEGDPGRSPTPRDLISTAYFARTTELVSRIAAILGKKADAKKYTALHRRVMAAFNREFVSPSGRVVGDTQTGYLLALGFDLLPMVKRAHAAEQLVALIEKRGWKLSTGFVGTPLLAPVLTACGRTDVAYKLLLQKEYPSWIYPILQGATTMWERWNSYTKEKGFGDVGMNSFNHYAYGSIGEWMYSTVAGIEPDPKHPGYKHVLIRPQPGGGLTWARGELETRYGRISSAWKLEKGKMILDLTIPANTSATVVLPGQKPKKVLAGTYLFKVAGPKPSP